MKRAFFCIGAEGSGTYMLAEAFVSSGCTYCDKDDVDEFLKEQQPDLLVLRRSLPHAGHWPGIHNILTSLERNHYGFRLLCLTREPNSSKRSVMKRKKSSYKAFEYEEAFRKCGEYVDRYAGMVVPYEYFVLSKNYRKSLFDQLDLPAPQMEFYDGNTKYYE